MEILREENYGEFVNFAATHKVTSFTQSLEWAKLKSGWGKEIIVSRDEKGNIKGAMLVLIQRLPIVKNSFLYAPHGPICDFEDIDTLKDLLDGVKELGKKYKGFLFKCDPCIREEEKKGIENFRKLGFKHEEGRKDFETIQVRFNYALTDIEGKTEDEVIMGFTQKTRYNIRVAMKKGVECRICDKSALPEFYRIFEVTAKRDNFILRPIEYYEKMMDSFGDKIRLYLCYYNDRAISGALCIQYARKTYYVFGASDNEYRNVMPNYLMQWSMIRWALEGNCTVYDFLGIPVNADESSPMAGVLRFKKGFNGEVVGYAGEFDYVLNGFVNFMFNAATKLKKKYFAIYRALRGKKD